MKDYVYKEGYKPDKCWYRGRYVTSGLIDLVRNCIIGGDEMSDECIILIALYLRIDEEMKPEQILAKINYNADAILNRIQNNRGIKPSNEDEEFLMRILGWREFCILQSEIAQGGSVRLGISVDKKNNKNGYYLIADSMEGDDEEDFENNKESNPFVSAMSAMSGDK